MERKAANKDGVFTKFTKSMLKRQLAAPTQLPNNMEDIMDHSIATLKFFKTRGTPSRKWALSNLWTQRNTVLGLAPLSDKWIVTCGSDG